MTLWENEAERERFDSEERLEHELTDILDANGGDVEKSLPLVRNLLLGNTAYFNIVARSYLLDLGWAGPDTSNDEDDDHDDDDHAEIQQAEGSGESLRRSDDLLNTATPTTPAQDDRGGLVRPDTSDTGAAPVTTPTDTNTIASIPFMWTHDLKAKVLDLGYTNEQISRMPISEAHRIVTEGIRADQYKPPDGDRSGSIERDTSFQPATPSPSVSNGGGSAVIDASSGHATPTPTPPSTAKPPASVTPIKLPPKKPPVKQPPVIKSVLVGFFARATGDGRLWGEVYWDQLPNMRRMGNLAAVILDNAAPPPNDGKRYKLHEVIKPEEFDGYYKKAGLAA